DNPGARPVDRAARSARRWIAHRDHRSRSAGGHAKSVPARRVALVHEWLVTYAGSEKVVEQILQLFPQADLYSVVDFFPESQ
ncbi:hypothetical protein AB4Y44_42845, partial [Paraburkholderia sp. BR10937]